MKKKIEKEKSKIMDPLKSSKRRWVKYLKQKNKRILKLKVPNKEQH